MQRRNFIKLASSLCGLSVLPFNLNAKSTDFSGKLVVTIQAEGGWDVAGLCDPKMNVAGESIINTWAQSQEIQQAGNIRYAPFANNTQFFEKYYKDMLVINGIDAQTNSHTAGVTHNWSGRISAGYPSLTSLYSHVSNPDMAMSYINNGGYSESAGIIRSTRLDQTDNLRNILNVNNNLWDFSNYLHVDELERVNNARTQRLQRLLSKKDAVPLEKNNWLNYHNALNSSDSLNVFAENIENIAQLEENISQGNFSSNLNLQAQLAIVAMYSGVSASADLYMGGFDTHTTSDNDHAIVQTMLLDGIDKLWTYAEQYGIADRLVVVIGSEFGRTPYYNNDNGKDHWPIGSTIIMERNASWTNRMVGATDEGLFAQKINPNTLAVDNNSGSIIYPKDVMSSLRKYLAIDQHATTLVYPLKEEVEFDFFNGTYSTKQGSDARNLIRI
jgi:hypothetical protein